jgi:Zn-dependent protease/predicted transcriptional regulator
MEANIKLGKIFGIEIGVSYSWFVIFFLITFFLYSTFAQEHRGWPAYLLVASALIGSGLFFLSLLAHELAHCLVALSKQLPVRSITLFMFGGVSLIEKEATSAGTEFLVAIVGPVSSFLISLFFLLISKLVNQASPLGAIAAYLSMINLGLAIFNLIPGYPLDGGRVFRAIVWAVTGSLQKATRISTSVGMGFGYLFMIIGIMVAFPAHNLINGLWLAAIGWFLLDAARGSRRAVVFERAIKGVHAKDVMSSNAMAVPANVSLSDFFDRFVMKTGQQCFIVEEDERLLGIITSAELKAVPRDQWQTTMVGQIMRPFERMKLVGPQDELARVVTIMDGENVNQVAVVTEGRLEGLIGREDILRFINRRAEFDH